MAAKSPEEHDEDRASAVRVSMHDVAAQAGVSRSTVSLALSGHPSIPEVTRERVRAAALQLGYRKNPLVAALMSVRRTGAEKSTEKAPLAFLTSNVPPEKWGQGATHRRFHAAARARAAEFGFYLHEISVGDPAMKPKRVRELLKARGIHGVLVAPLPGDQTRLDFDVNDFATVGIGSSVQDPAIDRVSDDHFYGSRLAFEKCLSLGYRRIGLALAANVSRRLEHRWWSGYLVAQQHLARALRFPALMPETREEISALLNPWITRHRLDAVVFSIRDDETMNGAPPNIGLVSLSVHNESGQIAGIRQNERRVGEDAIDLLVEKLHRWETGCSESPRLHLVRGVWSPGASAPGFGLDRKTLLHTDHR
jgi:LacI family transcriptional regulator